MMPNSMKVLREIGIEERLRETAFEPYSHLNRAWDTGEIMRELPMPESLFGAPYLCMHRGDLHAALVSVVPSEVVHLGKKLVGVDQGAGQVTLAFEDGTGARADALIGADGVHSFVRDLVVGPDMPIHKGRIAYRGIFPSALLPPPAYAMHYAENHSEDQTGSHLVKRNKHVNQSILRVRVQIDAQINPERESHRRG